MKTYSTSRWKIKRSEEEKGKINSLNTRYSTMFYYLNQSFERGEIDLNTLNTVKNTLAENYIKESTSIFVDTRLNRIETGFNRVLNNQLEKIAKSFR
jgi:hypothetical protein